MTTMERRGATKPKTLTLLTLTLVLAAAAVAPARAQTYPRDRRGLYLGLNAGFGGAGYTADLGKRTVTDDPYGGAAGGLRFGYAFNNKLALGLESLGFGTDDNGPDDDGWGMGAGVLALTWWPGGGGFFVRGGLGAAGGDVLRRDGVLQHIPDKPAALFGLGYEWQLSTHFALGLAADAVGVELGETLLLEDQSATMGTFTLQANWYF